MKTRSQLDQLLVTLDVDVESFALCRIKRGRRLIGEPVDAVMVHYVLSGTHYMSIEGHAPVICPAGCIVLIPPNLQPRVSLDDGPVIDVPALEGSTITREGVLLIDAADGGEGDLQYVSGIVLASFSGSFGLFDRLKEPAAHDVGNLDMVRHAYALMLEEVANPGIGARALTSALMKACLILVLRRMMACGGVESSLVGSLSDQRFSRTIGAVLDRPGFPHTVASMADDAGMSRSSFSRHFSATFDMSPMEFVAKTRLHHAAQMLRSTPLPVKVIAGNVGFSSRSHFSRAFRAAYGTDPTKYRESRQNAPTNAPTALYGSRQTFGLLEEARSS